MSRCLKLIAGLCVVSAACLTSVSCIRSRRTSFEDQTVKSIAVDMKDEHILQIFNITQDEVRKRVAGLAALRAGATAEPMNSQRFASIKDYRLGDIRNKIEMAINPTVVANENEQPQHEMAAYPICNSETNEASWQDDRNVTIRFSDSLFEAKANTLHLESALLRLYKMNPNRTSTEPIEPPKACAEPNIDSQIRVTISILRKNRKERKKRICNTLMMNVTQTGWVEIDIKRAINIWETVERRLSNVLVGYLMIEVHDEEERPLKPGLFFRPPKCDQAGHAIPWNFYRSYSTLPSSFTEGVPRSPRIDIKLIGYASLLPHNPRARPNFNLNREIYRLSHRNSEESTTSITPAHNLLDPSASTDVHRHRQRHARHHHHHSHGSAPTADTNAAESTAVIGSTKSDVSAEEPNGQTLDC